MDKLIITVAIIGGITTREKSPYPPMTPQEIAESAIESYHAGASVCHIHVRDPQTHQPSMKFELYQEVFERIREKCDILINLSTGSGGRLLYNPLTSGSAWDTAGLKSPEERVEHVVKLKPELCSLDVGTLNFGSFAFINLVSVVEKMAKMIKEAGTKPELEVFDIGHIRIANHLLRQGLVEKPPLFQLCLGIPWGIEATTENLVYMRNNLPRDALWYAFGIGPQHFQIAAISMINGGHARVGFEDNLFIRKNVLATSNAQMVRKVVEIAELMDREVATPKEARQILGLKN
ncbi:MAG: 3-keto-5-aminohexanoate cleavage protein [Deltaproteobacteria bacterium]|nr:3-keto-5-aminohexanoate cleavage protein [Deltaproteobacteria bacterium]